MGFFLHRVNYVFKNITLEILIIYFYSLTNNLEKIKTIWGYHTNYLSEGQI